MVEKVLKIGLAVLIQYRRLTDNQPRTTSHVAVASTRYAYLRRAVKTTQHHQMHNNGLEIVWDTNFSFFAMDG